MALGLSRKGFRRRGAPPLPPAVWLAPSPPAFGVHPSPGVPPFYALYLQAVANKKREKGGEGERAPRGPIEGPPGGYNVRLYSACTPLKYYHSRLQHIGRGVRASEGKKIVGVVSLGRRLRPPPSPPWGGGVSSAVGRRRRLLRAPRRVRARAWGASLRRAAKKRGYTIGRGSFPPRFFSLCNL